MHSPASTGSVILTSIGAWTASILVGVPVTWFILNFFNIHLQLPRFPRSSYSSPFSSPFGSRYPSPAYTPPVRTQPNVPQAPSTSRVPGPPPANPATRNSASSAKVPGPPPGSTANSRPKTVSPATSTGVTPPGHWTTIGRLEKGNRVFVEWRGSWYPATVTGSNAYGKIPIHYDGHDASWDESVPEERVRIMDSNHIQQYGPGELAETRRPAARNPFAPDTSRFLSQEMRTWTGPDGKQICKAKLAAASTTGVILINDEGGRVQHDHPENRTAVGQRSGVR